jgi:GTPase SAR1 family protein
MGGARQYQSLFGTPLDKRDTWQSQTGDNLFLISSTSKFMLQQSHYRRADGALLVFSVTDRHSFERLPNWLKELRDHAGDTLSCVMVMENKIDLLEGLQKDDPDIVQEDEVQTFCKNNALMYARVTAKCNHSCSTPPSRWGGEPVQEAIQKVVERIHSRQIGQNELNKLRGNKILSAPPLVPTSMNTKPLEASSKCC